LSTVETQRRSSTGAEVAYRRHNKCGDLRPNSIIRYPAIQLASCSQTWFPTCRRQVRDIDMSR